MAEIEIGVLSRQCLARRIPDRETLERQIADWQAGATPRRRPSIGDSGQKTLG